MQTVSETTLRGLSRTPLVLIHGFTDTSRTWELVLPALERRHDVLAPTLVGHAGGPPLGDGEVTRDLSPTRVERAMDDAGFETAHIVGNSLGGYFALQLAARGRARSVVALAPAGGWAKGDDSYEETLALLRRAPASRSSSVAPHADAIAATPEGRRRATLFIAVNYEHIPAELLAHQTRGVAALRRRGADDRVRDARGLRRSTPRRSPARCAIVWGTEDRLLPWPTAAVRYREDWLPNADWVVLDGVGHCPQLDVPLETAQLILGFTQP